MNALFSFVRSAFDWTWKTSVCAALLIALVLLAQKLLDNWLTPRWRCALSLLVLIRLLLPFAPASSLSLENLFPGGSWLRNAAASDSPRVATDGQFFARDEIENIPSHGSAFAHHLTTGGALTLIWLLGWACLMALAGWRYIKWSRWAETAKTITDPRILALLDGARETLGVRQPVTALSVPCGVGPAVFGIWRARVLLPENILDTLSEAELRMVLLHEMAHVKRRDPLLNALLIGVQLMHWFNPLVWLGHRRIRADLELVCDEMVMARVGPEERPGYGRLLLRLMDEFSTSNRFLSSAAPVVGSKYEIKRRIIMIKNHGQNSRLASGVAIFIATALCCATFTRASSSQSSPTQASSKLPDRALPGPLIVCSTTPAALGTIKAGDIVSYTFMVTNAGDQTLEISRVVPSCGCTAAKEFTRKIEPGRIGKIPIQFNSAHKSGKVGKTLTVFSNAKNQPAQVLSFKAEILAATEKPVQVTLK